ncbi:Oidioi.mRNA.OKI2018_I69.PAR.g12480.t1.cds [Oikopleura dioica]|uniref:Oidioi.mRNA.OKI2018_I69.PAR.g12480.t1.cds n=1 Tax=Oikopleura dioica TaxID=34765 RepID=A0ABN7S463_OIKDI|nr:Oidioi.mRNA.OKI2018_I69.PAR.g12480.t1.cds [Oikopleura dioica]
MISPLKLSVVKCSSLLEEITADDDLGAEIVDDRRKVARTSSDARQRRLDDFLLLSSAVKEPIAFSAQRSRPTFSSEPAGKSTSQERFQERKRESPTKRNGAALEVRDTASRTSIEDIHDQRRFLSTT